MRSKIWLAFSLLVLIGVVGAQAIPSCACNCLSSCTATCAGPGGPTTCNALGGLCAGKPGCGGSGGCLTASHVKTLLEQIMDHPAIVPVGGQEGRAVARLTWHLTQHVEEGSLGEVYSAGTGFLLSDGPGKVRAPELAFVSQARSHEADAPGAFRLGSPNLVAEFLSAKTTGAVAEQDAQSWIKAGTQAVLVVDSTQKTVSVYRGSQTPEVVGQGGVLDLSDVVPGWTLRLDDLFE